MDNPEKTPNPQSIKAIPTLKFYEKTYGKGCEGNDQKGLRTFKDYESREKLSRLKTELMWIKNNYVADLVCNEVIGPKRRSRYQSYSNWASIMLQILTKK